MKIYQVIALIATSAQAAQPTPQELLEALNTAAVTWHHTVKQARIASIIMQDLGPCGASQIAAWSDFATRTIALNSQCRWDHGIAAQPLKVTVAHEFGHLLANSAAHSSDRHSVMFWQVRKRQHVTLADLEGRQ